jgi:hypothetical protein
LLRFGGNGWRMKRSDWRGSDWRGSDWRGSDGGNRRHRGRRIGDWNILSVTNDVFLLLRNRPGNLSGRRPGRKHHVDAILLQAFGSGKAGRLHG